VETTNKWTQAIVARLLRKPHLRANRVYGENPSASLSTSNLQKPCVSRELRAARVPLVTWAVRQHRAWAAALQRCGNHARGSGLWLGFVVCVSSIAIFSSCARVRAKGDATAAVAVGITRVARKTLQRQITLSSELVPFQEIDVYAKESGYVQKLYVDYGSRVQAGQLMATLEIPELQAQIQEDQAAIKNAANQVSRAEHELKRYQAQSEVLHLDYTRLNGVFQSQPGLVAQQEVDDAQGKDLAAASQVDAAEAALEGARSELLMSKAKLTHDQTLFDYSRITAPFAGVVTQRYANLGTLMQAGTNSSTQAIPLVKLSQDDLFRLVIPVPESSVRFIRVGDSVEVRVSSLKRAFLGKVARFSVDVREDTRTMHTEVDVPNPGRVLMPGLYAEATLTLEKRDNALAVPLEAVNREGEQASVYLVGGDGKVEERRVVLGLETPTDVEVTQGLAEGESVIVSDRSGLKPGDLVTPKVVNMIPYTGQGQQ
jgi:RND family efflux transporter MFP subunit